MTEVSEEENTSHELSVDDDEEAEDDWMEDDEIDVDEQLIQQARQEELDNWDRFKVGTLIDAEQARDEGYKHLQTRWVNAGVGVGRDVR